MQMVTLADVKKALNITGTYQDDTLTIYMNEAMDFLKDAGVSEANITTGVVARGVADLWDYGSGSGQLSTYFKQRATQLAYRG
jgi:hypothetical protein